MDKLTEIEILNESDLKGELSDKELQHLSELKKKYMEELNNNSMITQCNNIYCIKNTSCFHFELFKSKSENTLKRGGGNQNKGCGMYLKSF